MLARFLAHPVQLALVAAAHLLRFGKVVLDALAWQVRRRAFAAAVLFVRFRLVRHGVELVGLAQAAASCSASLNGQTWLDF